ncbi:super-infection exclusion protein B [Bradyrhizobium sp. SSUT77]|uniref:super-infection exclusion protein B n=1 Tax=Bradyrhizobium sp. SSUT77 TaxID=3040603 RepID=UPI00244902B8|nr:super-infection exclusion protein B [Bradyrhizobium sp. SSUT77]MDH2346645.1 super-infection exclusion protein B [Bradyrhizobium sp. SSUT77]
METIASVVLALLKSGLRIYVAVLIAASAALFLPAGLLETLGISEFRNAHRMELGFAFLASASLVTGHLLFAVGNLVSKPFRQRKFARDLRETLETLTYDEKMFLQPYIHGGENSNIASYADGVANGLVAKKILYRASNASIPGTILAFPFNMQPYARKDLMKHPELLD